MTASALALFAFARAAVAAPYYPPRNASEVEASQSPTSRPRTDGVLPLLDMPAIAAPHRAGLFARPEAALGLPAGLENTPAISNFRPSDPGDLGASVGFDVPSAPVPEHFWTQKLVNLPTEPTSDEVTIPEPASLVLLLTGLAGLWARGRLRRKNDAPMSRS